MRSRWHSWGGLFILILAGTATSCSKPDDLYPLKIGAQWSYNITNGFPLLPQQVKVIRRVPVAGGQGFEIGGTMGISRIGWQGTTLVASVLPNTRFPDQPLPLLVANDPKATRTWSGTVETAGKTYHAQAQLTQSPEHTRKNSRDYDGIKTELTMTILPSKQETQKMTVQLETFYARGVGVLTQNEWINGQLECGLEYLSGP